MTMQPKRFITLLCIIWFVNLHAQEKKRLEVFFTTNVSGLTKLIKPQAYTNNQEREKVIQKVLSICHDNAHLTAHFDSIAYDSTGTKAYLNTGKQYKWASISNGNIDDGILHTVRFSEKIYTNKPLYYKQLIKLQERLLVHYENNGYPFASVKLDSITITDSTLAGQLFLEKNTRITIDSITIKGDPKITPIYLYNYLGIKPGSLYDESKIKKVNTRISELPFLESTSPAVVKFTTKETKLALNLKTKRASQFDGILGILPDATTGKTIFTGDLKLKLNNGLGKGELIDINWRRLQSQTQDLRTQLVYPYLFKTSFGLDFEFQLYKRDTTFLDVTNTIGIQYLLTGENHFKIYYQNKTSTLLSAENLSVITATPQILDVNTNSYGLEFLFEQLDYRINPRKGYSIAINGNVGTKEIKRNTNINDAIYDSLQLKSTQYKANFSGNLFLPVLKRSTLKLGIKSAIISNPSLFTNELFRIGGLKNLRGFDEESIFASSYSIFTLEYRLLIEENSYIYLFGDAAIYENKSINSNLSDLPIGFGAGVSFETKAGIFSINYALGKQFDNPILIREGKIHFGLINYF